LYNVDITTYVQLTFISCQFNGKALQEYSVDTFSGIVLLRIGVALYYTSLQDGLAGSLVKVPNRVPIHIISDFHEQQERLIKYETNKHFSSGDFFSTTFGTVNMILTARGQVWVIPVIDDYSIYESTTYGGSGENMPPDRRYRVAPGSMTGGSIRVLKALHVPLLAESVNHESIFHSNGTSTTGNTTTATPIDSGRRLALLLATDPDSSTAEHAFYMIEVQADAINSFTNLDRLPKPFVGGSVSGGPTSQGGLGTVDPTTLKVSPCGRRFAWADTDNRICVMTMPIYIDPNYMPESLYNLTERTDDAWMAEEQQVDDDSSNATTSTPPKYQYYCLPSTNDNGEPMAGTMVSLNWSPGGRYLAVEHSARNQFSIITVVDCGNPEPEIKQDNDTAIPSRQTVSDIKIGNAVQVTPSRFNSYGMYWGISSFDIFLQETLDYQFSASLPSTTIYFLSDRDIISDVASPWGSRQPLPHFPRLVSTVYALPLKPRPGVNSTLGFDDSLASILDGRFAGGGAMEVYARKMEDYKKYNEEKANEDDWFRRRNLLSKLTKAFVNVPNQRKLSSYQRDLLFSHMRAGFTNTAPSPFPKDLDIDFSSLDEISQNTYRISKIVPDKFVRVLAQCPTNGGLSLIVSNGDEEDATKNFIFYSFEAFPSDGASSQTVEDIKKYGLSTDRKHFYVTSELGKIRVVANYEYSISTMISDEEWTSGRANHEGLTLSVWPALEYQQMYNDAWRLLRDYFYDVNMHGVDWNAVHSRYKGLVKRCAKREELDDVLGQMISELSALHAFVYGGEYQVPKSPNALPAFLGAQLVRTPDWKGYMITEIPHPDPDFSILDGNQVYSPLSDQTLRLSGQKGLQVGDVIVAINGESVLNGVDINMHLRGLARRSVRLEVLRLSSADLFKLNHSTTTEATPEPVIVVPIGPDDLLSLQYNAHEWKTRQKAKEFAAAAGISVGYIHMQAMDKDGVDAFARGYFPDYDKQGLIIDVRHNQGGNIDSWIESYLQRKVWSYWRGRSATSRNGDIDWDQQFAFRGKVVVLVDEYTASNGEGVARGISELRLGKIIGTQTWGGGIWGSSANHLVDGGIAAAPQWGTWNAKFGWGSGIEMTGLTPDFIVDNDPYQTYFGNDFQLEAAIQHLKEAIRKDPVVEPTIPEPHPDTSLKGEVCPND
jgi:C-terminal processing protease CtpA/Prc